MKGRTLVTKKAHAYRTIGEASDIVGVPAHVLRFWETKFSHIRPMKKGGGRRYFRPEDISLLQGIKVFLYEKEYAIKDLQDFLRDEGPGKVIAAGAAPTMASTSEPEPKPAPEVVETAPVADVKRAKAPAQEVAETASESAESEAEATAKADAGTHTLLGALSQLQGARAKLDAALKKG